LSERLKYQWRLQEERTVAEKLKIRMRGAIRLIQNCLDPLEGPEDLDIETIEVHWVTLKEYHKKYVQLQKTIRELKTLLGEAGEDQQ